VQRALDLGGSKLMHAKDDDGKSQWAVLLDPNGVAFGIIPIVPAEAISPSDGAASPDSAAPVGRISWLHLTISDASAIRDFYRQVVEWSVQNLELEDSGERYADYNMLGEDGTPAAGICHARGVNVGLPPVWMIYLAVGDLAIDHRGGNRPNAQALRPLGDGGPFHVEDTYLARWAVDQLNGLLARGAPRCEQN
jgi:predicted enzyme related to lactoylglutathione lyase